MADRVSAIIKAFAQGEIVVVTDDEDREGEGDLVVAASLCTQEKMAFIIRHTSGIVCAPCVMIVARIALTPVTLGVCETTCFWPGWKKNSRPRSSCPSW